MDEETEVAGIVHIGGEGSTDVSAANIAASGFPEHLVPSPWKRLRFIFHNFKSLPHGDEASVISDELDCHGYRWRLELYPGGFGRPNAGYVSLYLECSGMAGALPDEGKSWLDEGVHAKYCMRFGSDEIYLSSPSHGVKVYESETESWGTGKVITRKEVLARNSDDPARDFLDDSGNLWVDVDLQVGMPRPLSSKPANSIKADMAKVLDVACEENSDVVFQVGDRIFHCISALLQVRATELYALTSEYDKSTPIPISGVCPDTFQLLVLTVYGGEIPDDKKTVDVLKALISAADRFGCTKSKHQAEHELVVSNSIGVDNVAELLLFADGANCALIKEAATLYSLSNLKDVRKTEGYAKLKESPHVLEELLIESVEAHEKRPASPIPPERDYKRMRVSALRSKLDGKGLDVDGSRECLHLVSRRPMRPRLLLMPQRMTMTTPTPVMRAVPKLHV